MKAVVFTLGCKVNACESDSIIKSLENLGYEVFSDLVYADLYIVNTCAVTSEAEHKSRQTVARIKKINPQAEIIFTGCASQNAPKDFIEKTGVKLVTGTFLKSKLANKINERGIIVEKEETEFDEMIFPEKTRTRAYVKIEDGCNNFCSYCLIPYLRGRERSRKPENVLAEIENTTAKEVVLTGINVTAYDYGGIRLPQLLLMLKDVKKRIRLGSLEAGVVTEELLSASKNLYDFAPHFHLSLQSGSDAVLKKMNRHYTFAEYLSRIKSIRKYYPSAGITTDIIAGFPTETEEDFLQSVNAIKEAEFSDAHCFPYSKRKGTVAYNMKDLSKEVKKTRTNELIKVASEYKKRFIEKNLGAVCEFLGEEYDGEYTSGYTGNYIKCYVKGNYGGQMINVKLNEFYKEGATATVEE